MKIIYKLIVKVIDNQETGFSKDFGTVFLIKISLNHKVTPGRLTDDERKNLTRIPDNVETRDVLENLLFNLSLMGILTDDNVRQIIHNR